MYLHTADSVPEYGKYCLYSLTCPTSILIIIRAKYSIVLSSNERTVQFLLMCVISLIRESDLFKVTKLFVTKCHKCCFVHVSQTE